MELRIKKSDFKRKFIDSSGVHELQFLKIEIKKESPEISEITNTLKFDKQTTTLRDVFNILMKKYRVKSIANYGFWHSKNNKWLDLDTPLSECNLEHMEVLTFLKKKE